MARFLQENVRRAWKGTVIVMKSGITTIRYTLLLNGSPRMLVFNVSPTTLEPTLQAALLEKPAWDLMMTIADKFDNGELKDMPKKSKPSRVRKVNELTQNQVSKPMKRCKH
jgi:hypothetical protein